MRSLFALIFALVLAAAGLAPAQTPPSQPPTPQQPTQQPQQQPAPPQQQQPAPTARVFASDAGIVFNQIKPDRTADFEYGVTKIKEALQKSDKPERKQQAASWKVFRVLEPGPNGVVFYLFVIDPAVKGADYAVGKILTEAFSVQEVQEIWKRYSESYAGGQNLLNLTLVSSFASQ